MSAAGYVVRETDPFTEKLPTLLSLRIRSPHVLRIQLNWARMRAAVLELFPPPPGLPVDRPAYLREVDEVYTTDAYHSLSIEGYRVSAELIERVRAGDWNPAMREADRRDQNALAARGYWQAFQEVKRSLEKILAGESAGATVHRDHGGWYREMFAPQVAAQIVEPATLAGYRNGPVFIRRSRHVPPSVEAVRDLMPTFFELLEQEQEPAVRVVLGHFFFVFIHPYMDGNGRMGRFLMNAMLASGGYPWRVVPLAGRAAYMAALESASTEAEIRPFARFLANLVTAPNVAAPA
jgi:Fic family protein